MALTALYTESINFYQAAALVIGMDVGTTVKALLATIGGSVGARRTGFSHFIYNIMTGTMALLLISPFIWLWEKLSPGTLIENAEIALVAFHTTFNALGVIVALPFTRRFAAFIERIIPEKLPSYVQKLDTQLLQQPDLALTEAQLVIERQIKALLLHLQAIVFGEGKGLLVNLRQLQDAIDEVHAYIDKINLSEEKGVDWERLIELIHTLDHMQRLHERCEEENRAIVAREIQELQETKELLLNQIEILLDGFSSQNWANSVKDTKAILEEIEDDHEAYRHMIVERVGRGQLDVRHATRLLEARRWLLRVSRHVAQINKHFAAAILAAGAEK